MVVVSLIPPKELKGDTIGCDACDIKYSRNDYTTLYDANKIAYFFYPSHDEDTKMDLELFLCNVCLFNHLKKMSSGEEVKLIILDGEEQHNCTFTPEEMDEEDEGYGFFGASKDEYDDDPSHELDVTDYEDEEDDDDEDDGEYDYLK